MNEAGEIDRADKGIPTRIRVHSIGGQDTSLTKALVPAINHGSASDLSLT